MQFYGFTGEKSTQDACNRRVSAFAFDIGEWDDGYGSIPVSGRGVHSMFQLPVYLPPDFNRDDFRRAPTVRTLPAPADGRLPDDFYATTIYPEYFHVDDEWRLIEDPRMDCAVVFVEGRPRAVEARRVVKGDEVAVGRGEDLSNGVFVHHEAFSGGNGKDTSMAFAFRTGRSRESSYSRDYDELYDILRYERDHGYIVWVLGPAVAFDHDARRSMQKLIETGYAHALLAGNALATHDLEACVFQSGLGQHIYTKEILSGGHYHHLEVINRVREAGSVAAFVERQDLKDGIMAACVRSKVPYVLAGSIRDDGPLPDVLADAYAAQDAMRTHTLKATTVIALATQLHTIATGNMTPSWRNENGVLRPVYFYTVDISEFAVNKLRDRGSLSVNSIVTNVQDFLVHAARSLGVTS
jgi:lysine-ketoglutarate reductase/saccharopine dehydrogenase-like protein (TIGR00300 family)